jgi:hypothetical protein
MANKQLNRLAIVFFGGLMAIRISGFLNELFWLEGSVGLTALAFRLASWQNASSRRAKYRLSVTSSQPPQP